MIRSIVSLAAALSAALASHPAVAGGHTNEGIGGSASDGWSVEARHGPTVPFRVTLDEATWMSVDVSPDGERLVFDILGDLYTLPMEGGDARRITAGPAYDAQPRFSPDGSQIVFVSDRDGSSNLWVVRPDGEDPQALTQQRDATFSSPDWTPDGQYIVVSRHDDLRIEPGHDLYLIHRDGGRGIRLVGRERGPLGAVASPAGRRIYYSRTEGLTGSSIEQFDRRSGRVEPLVGGEGQAMRPAVSPDGRWLAFGRRLDNETRMVLRELSSGKDQLLDVTLDHPHLHPLSDVDRLPGFAFTPDQSAIIYSAHGKLRRFDLARGVSTVIPFRAEFEQDLQRPHTVKRRITNGPVQPKLLRWTHQNPNGRELYFSAAGTNYRHDVSSGVTAPVGDGPGFEYSPAVSPDGKWLAYVTWSDAAGGHIYKTALDHDATVRLTERPGVYEHLSWSPDGSKLVFLQGSGGERPGRANLAEPYVKSLRWIDTERGGASRLVMRVPPRGDRRQEMRPSFDRTGRRIYFSETPVRRGPTWLSSVRLDGSDRRRHLEFAFAEDLMPSPDGQWLAFTESFEAWLVPLPAAGSEPVEVVRSGGALPVARLSNEGAYFLNWSGDGQAITWGWGPDFYRLPLKDAINEGSGSQPEKITISFTEPRAKAAGTLLLEGARLITMGNAGVVESGDVLIEDDRIKAVGASGTLPVPADAEVLDLRGKTIIPGLIDLHMHYRESHNTEIFPRNDWGYIVHLAFGVTTVRNPSARSQAVFTQAEMIELGRSPGPRTFSTGDPLYFVETPFARPMSSLDDARNQVGRLKSLGASAVKQYRQSRREQRQWIVQAGREHDMPVVAEGAWKIFHNLTTVMDGHTTLEHAFKLGRLYKDVRSLVAASGIHYTPTLFVTLHGSAGDYFFRESDAFANRKLLRFMPFDKLAEKVRQRDLQPRDSYYFMNLAADSAAIMKEGGNVGYGAHGDLLGLGAHWELWAMELGGFSPLEALRAATLNSAAAMGLSDDIGSLDAGKLADLVILEGNPLEDLRNSTSATHVMKNGILRESETMDQVWPQERAFEGFYWRVAD